MAQPTRLSSSVSDRQHDWPTDALETAVRLQRQLCIGERDWHRLKHQRPRRAAEQIAAALVQLLSGDQPGSPQATEARLRALELLEHAERWLRSEISDPGCGSHRRPASETTDPDERLTAS